MPESRSAEAASLFRIGKGLRAERVELHSLSLRSAQRNFNNGSRVIGLLPRSSDHAIGVVDGVPLYLTKSSGTS